MCGITGFYMARGHSVPGMETLKKMTDSLSHRGPDGEGMFQEDEIGLGHRRLSIIDLATGNQPMLSEDKKYVLVFNGEIYNYLEIRKELEQLGHIFRTQSDTEVILKSYRQWGTDCQAKFNGMWAFALWDSERKQLFLSRDRLGEKPLFYYEQSGNLAFGSEIKTILHCFPDQAINHEIIGLYLTMAMIPAPFTIYKNIRKLMPGHYLLATQTGVRTFRYWDLPEINENDLIKDENKVLKTFESLFYDSVRLRMRSDVPSGAFLSGGLDSSSVVSAMTNFTEKPVETFTMGFLEKDFDERKLAAEVSRKFHTNHHEWVVKPDEVETALEKIIDHYDEPFGDPSAIPTGLVSKFASGYVKMVLTGDGGDEALSGYTNYSGENFAHQYQKLPAFIQKFLPSLVEMGSKTTSGNLRYKLNRIHKVLKSSGLPFQDRLRQKLSFVPLEMLDSIHKGGISFQDFYNNSMNHCKFSDPFYRLMHFQLKVTLPDDMLTKVDRMSMAYSLETRVPFLDHRLVEYLYQVDKRIKMKGFENKQILRKTIGKKLPPSLLSGKKKGFNVPLSKWFQTDTFDEKLKSVLTNKNTGLNPDGILQLIHRQKLGTMDSGTFLWVLLVLDTWFNKKNKKTA